MLYKKNSEKTLSKELFENPTEEYRGTPFWSWNCKVTKELIDRQTTYLKEMGFGGYHIHSRTGMDVPYLSDEFMELIKYCSVMAKEKKMLSWLYDEDRYPSGAAGGLVTQDPELRARHLLLTKEDRRASLSNRETAIKEGTDYFYNAYDIVFDGKGQIVSYKKICPDEEPEGVKWFTYVCPMEKSGWYNNLTYVDTMNKKAMDRFIEITHERYKEAVGEDFDGVIPAIFTDEPQVSKKATFAYGNSEESVCLPWSIVMDDLYEKRYGLKIDDTVPEIFWDRADGLPSRARYLYHDFVCEIFTAAFSDNVGKWCKDNGIALTGHVMGEQWLKTQTEHLGEAMRCYRGFEIPGIDMLGDDHEYMTAKQCQSAVHQYGREGMLSELYGVTGWDFDFRGHKNQGDWQAALGVTVRVPHLAWMSMHGDAKRDYPASIFYQSPWYREYKYIEDHFARLNTALTRGTPIVDVAVVHPIESYWLHWGPSQNTADDRNQLEWNHCRIIEWMLFSQLDFDFLSESLIPELYEETDKGFKAGKMTYKTVIVPSLETVRSTTLEALRKFRAKGGRVIFMGDVPKYVDALPSDEAKKFAETCEHIPFLNKDLVNALRDERQIEIMRTDGTRADSYFYNYREDSDCRWLFIARGHKAGERYGGGARLTVSIKGEFTPELYDTLTGKIGIPDYCVSEGNTYVKITAHEVDSFLFRLGKYEPSKKHVPEAVKTTVKTCINHRPVEYALSEENAMVIDCAEYRVDAPSLESDAEWYPEEELQRVNSICAKIAGIPAYNGTQPWVEPPEKLEHTVDLRYVFDSETDYEGAWLAIENAELCEVILNGVKAKGEVSGYFTDESIGKIRLPAIKKGSNELLIRTPIGIRTKVEWCYVLGHFGVRLCGCDKTITKMRGRIGYMSLTEQEMPFYTGNVDYKEEIEVKEKGCGIRVRVSEFTGALVKVFVDGEERGIIAFDPFCADLGQVEQGRHEITLRYFGTRENAFGALHNADVNERWKGPNVWQTSGSKFCYEYRIKKTGITAAPVFEIYK